MSDKIFKVKNVFNIKENIVIFYINLIEAC
jgi:hypothetical protein